MFLKCSMRRKNGKIHRNRSAVESRRVVQQHVLYLGEVINRQRVSWERAVSVFDETSSQLRQLSLIPRGSSDQRRGGGHVVGAAERTAVGASATVGLAGGLPVAGMRLDTFFAERLGCIREDTPWEKVLRALTIYRLLSPGSEWRLHRQRFATTALPDLLDTDASVAQTATRYRCHDRLLEHKEALFAHLRERWTDLFAPSFDILLYDLTSTYFECDVPEDENDPRKFGYSRYRSPTRCCRARRRPGQRPEVALGGLPSFKSGSLHLTGVSSACT